MNFSVKRVLKRRHNYLIPFLFIFCARCIYKSSYTPPSHPNIQTRRSDCKSLWKSDRIGQKSVFICELKIGGRRESQICVTLLNPPPPRPQRNLCSSVKSVGHRCVKTGNTLAISDISLIFAPCKVLNIRIMRTFNYNEIQNTPIWNEVKNWSDDRKMPL